MQNLLDYDDFKGILDEDTFNRLYRFLKRKIDFYTFNRIDYSNEELKELVKECIESMIYELSDRMKITKNLISEDGKIISSETVGELKETYYIPTIGEIEKHLKANEKYISNTIKLYFAHIGLMYRGF